MDFGNPLRKIKSQIKYETFHCSEIQSQRLTADKLSCSSQNESNCKAANHNLSQRMLFTSFRQLKTMHGTVPSPSLHLPPATLHLCN